MDNELTNSGSSTPDLYVFEGGSAIENTFVAVRPADPVTEAKIVLVGGSDPNGDGFYEIGEILGSTYAIDIDGIFPSYVAGELHFDAVQLVDNPAQGPTSGQYVGADIDAVGAIATAPPGIASPYCLSDGLCPCGNNDPTAGCLNSDGTGALLQAAGSTSVGADDLVLTATGVKKDVFGIFFMGGGQAPPTPFGDGLLCVSPGPATFCRFLLQSSGTTGVMSEGPGIVAYSQTLQLECMIDAGETWNFQAWYRDPSSPCGAFFNVSSAMSVTFTP